MEKEITLESGRKVKVDDAKFEKMRQAIKDNDVDNIVKYNIETLLSCRELMNDMAVETKKIAKLMDGRNPGDPLECQDCKKPISLKEALDYTGLCTKCWENNAD